VLKINVVGTSKQFVHAMEVRLEPVQLGGGTV